MLFLYDNFCSILNNWLYFATLSDLHKEPVFIWEEFVPTAKSDINVSSESPDLWEIIVWYPIFCANLITSSVSVTVPIWLSFIKIELEDWLIKPFFNLCKFVTYRSSPTICIPFSLFVNSDHAFQSFSAKGSSIDFILNFLIIFA